MDVSRGLPTVSAETNLPLQVVAMRFLSAVRTCSPISNSNWVFLLFVFVRHAWSMLAVLFTSCKDCESVLCLCVLINNVRIFAGE
jgi:hypothetical protein